MDALRAVPVDGIAAALDEFWSQEIVGEANGSLFKVAKGIGSTEWHAHDDQDEVFFVTHGTLVVELRAGERGRAVRDPARCRASPTCRRRDAVLDRGFDRDLLGGRREARVELRRRRAGLGAERGNR